MLILAGLLISAFLVACVLTPRVAAVAERFDLLDRPEARKVHTIAIPRIGGVAIFCTFCSVLTLCFMINPINTVFHGQKDLFFLFAGGALSFSLGLVDDLRQLGPRIKFLVQALAALTAYWGGIRIELINVPGIINYHLEWLSLPATVFWVLLVINAINLIDGLDGLAGGVSLFVCLVLAYLSIKCGRTGEAFTMVILAGSIMGFLVYNFNPASIFMGDAGSYFLGYMLATMSIYGSMKSHAAISFLVPILVLGVPILDTVWATLRRFLFGMRLFHPDREHFHHRLLRLGLTHRRAVLVLYGITALLGVSAVFHASLSAKGTGLLVFTISVGLLAFIFKLGYLNFLGLRTLLIWANDLINTMGINRDRRQFFAHQIAIMEANTPEAFWERLVKAANFLGMDYIEVRLGGELCNFKKFDDMIWFAPDIPQDKLTLYAKDRLYLRFPIETSSKSYGVFIVSKNAFNGDLIHSQTLLRLESLRRTLSEALFTFEQISGFELHDRRNAQYERRCQHIFHTKEKVYEERRINRVDRRQLQSATQLVYLERRTKNKKINKSQSITGKFATVFQIARKKIPSQETRTQLQKNESIPAAS